MLDNGLIDGVWVKDLRVLPDDRGFLMEMLRDDDEGFEVFGQAYMTGANNGVAKAWHHHEKQNDYFTTVSGNALVVLYDARENSPTHGMVNVFVQEAPESEYTGSEVEPHKKGNFLLKIPIGVVHGFAAIGCKQARIINIPTRHYEYKEPDELRLPWDSKDVPFQWPEYIKGGG